MLKPVNYIEYPIVESDRSHRCTTRKVKSIARQRKRLLRRMLIGGTTTECNLPTVMTGADVRDAIKLLEYNRSRQEEFRSISKLYHCGPTELIPRPIGIIPTIA